MNAGRGAFPDDDWKVFEGILSEFDDRRRPEAEVRRVFDALPGDLRDTALFWGFHDTVFRDDLWLFLRENGVPPPG